MHYAELYETINEAPDRASKEIIDKLKSKIKWRQDGCDKVLDVGSGTCSPLMKYIYPLLPATFAGLVGSDISVEMVQFARKKYESYNKCSFKVLDITTKELPAELCGEFDHVTSFFALQWIHDHKMALSNINKLLRSEGGDCLFVILIRTPIYDIYLIMQRFEKWASYMTDVNTGISSLYYNEDPAKDYSMLLKEAGFINRQIEIENFIFSFENVQEIKAVVKSVCPFMQRLTNELQEEFLSDFVAIMENPINYDLNVEFVCGKILFPYKLLAVYAEKPSVLSEMTS